MARSKCCTVFGSGCDGAVPCAGLIDVDGILYGTTAYGGDVTYRSGLGTVFRISTTGKEQVLHNFGVLRRRTPRSGLDPREQNALWNHQ